ncbi:MAG TPA: hypothetical protein VMM78_10150, partial [Thermomicrobiales bacterium]|nr:hypothetical protein [Thermomicrobiales bacterium]
MTRSRARSRQLPTLLVALTLMAALPIAFPVAVAAAGSSVVSNCDDGLDPVPPGSLRDAVEAANADGDATELDPHAIAFAADLPCDTITLAGAQLELSAHMTIQGPGADVLSVSGGGESR